MGFDTIEINLVIIQNSLQSKKNQLIFLPPISPIKVNKPKKGWVLSYLKISDPRAPSVRPFPPSSNCILISQLIGGLIQAR